MSYRAWTSAARKATSTNDAACYQEKYTQECVNPLGYSFFSLTPISWRMNPHPIVSLPRSPRLPSALPPVTGLCSYGVSSPMLYLTWVSTAISIFACDFVELPALVALLRRLSLLLRLFVSLSAPLLSSPPFLCPFFPNVDAKPGSLHSDVSNPASSPTLSLP